MIEGSSARHLSADGLNQFIESGAPAVIRLDGVPTALLVIDPPEGEMALRVRSDDGVVSDLESFRLITTGVVWFEGERYLELRIAGGGALLEAYPILCALADRVQLQGEEFDHAAQEVLVNFRQLLQGIGRMSESQEIGLIGELMVFRRFMEHFGPAPTLASWTGADNEEHDFRTHECDIEVKTTTSERRVHWVHGLAQLAPTPGRPLWLISIQLTGAGGAGTTLRDLVEDIRSGLVDAESIHQLNEKLRARSWHDEQAMLYTRRHLVRSSPMTMEVLEGFPSITPSLFEAAARTHERISQVSYRIDLTSLPDAQSPFPVDRLEIEE